MSCEHEWRQETKDWTLRCDLCGVRGVYCSDGRIKILERPKEEPKRDKIGE